ncbi:heparan-alpha-glucosaminide N-acetyltransferase domain-containing protein [Streptomyces gamaensis]|uniref:Heparan-alpha-glucosaminide N-acetyltransferase domain-containing protein n=1 Tax=Streptomyces gamaensis TaxID=1763542 RepID=A0ABW0Z4X4_9ACTN
MRDLRESRLVGLDAVRGLAILGMFAVHVGPAPYRDGPGYVLVAADGRAPAVFTLVAGFSLALARGGTTPRPGPPPRTTIVRCAVLALLGLALASLQTGILVILAFYAAYFLACEPFTRLRTPVLAAVAAGSAVLGPLASYVLGPPLGVRAQGRGGTPSLSDLTTWEGAGRALTDLLVTGAYPLLTYLPYLLIGLVLGRVADPRRPGTARRMAGWGTAAAVAGYGGAWLATERLGGRERLLAAIAEHHPGASAAADPVRAVLARQFGAIPSTSWDWLLIAEPYSQTPLETLGNAGVGGALIGLAMAFTNPRVLRLLRPLAVVGAMSLSVYVVHALALAWPAYGARSWQALGWFSAAALAGACAWRYAWRGSPLRHGPLEWALRSAAGRHRPASAPPSSSAPAPPTPSAVGRTPERDR